MDLIGNSTHTRIRAQAVAAEGLCGNPPVEAGRPGILKTRRLEDGWRAASAILEAEGQRELAAQVPRLVDQMPPPQTEKELLRAEIISRVRKDPVTERIPGH